MFSQHSAPPVTAHVSDSIRVHRARQWALPPVQLPVEKAYFEQIIENAPEAISIIDTDLKHFAYQRRVHPHVRLYASEAVGQRIDPLIVPPDRYAETAWIPRLSRRKARYRSRPVASEKTAHWLRFCSPRHRLQ